MQQRVHQSSRIQFRPYKNVPGQSDTKTVNRSAQQQIGHRRVRWHRQATQHAARTDSNDAIRLATLTNRITLCSLILLQICHGLTATLRDQWYDR